MHDRFFLVWLTSTLIPGTCGMGRNLGRFSSMFADSSLGTMILRCQIENLAHGLEDRGRLTSCSNGQQHFHGRLEHLIYDATTKGLRKNNLDNLTALRKERVVPLRMESSWLEIQLVHF
jgi:hypothetical protein